MSIPEPEQKHAGGVYLYRWDSLGISVQVDRLHQDRSHLTGEVRVRDKTDELLEMTVISLTSQQARDRLAKALSGQINHVDWDTVIKYAALWTVSLFRQGEPVERIGSKPQSMVMDYRLQPILEEGQTTTIYGPGGSGKSYIADLIAVSVQCGKPVLGWEPKQGNVLFLDWETSTPFHSKRVWAIKRGLKMEADETELYYRFCSEPLAADIVEVQRLVMDNDIELIIIDSQVAASAGDIEKAQSASEFYNSLRSLRKTSVVIDHVPKRDEGQRMPFGSVFKWNRSRSCFEVDNYQLAGKKEYAMALYHRKHNEGAILPDIGIRVEFLYEGTNLDMVTFTKTEVSEHLAAGLSLSDQIYTVLKRGSKTVSEIYDLIGRKASKATIRTRLNEDKDTFFKAGDMWGLLEKHYSDE